MPDRELGPSTPHGRRIAPSEPAPRAVNAESITLSPAVGLMPRPKPWSSGLDNRDCAFGHASALPRTDSRRGDVGSGTHCVPGGTGRSGGPVVVLSTGARSAWTVGK
jgi:hypothetical protein